MCLETSSLPLWSDAALLLHIIHSERVNGRVVAEVGAHSAEVKSGPAARHTDPLGALFVLKRAAMLTARVKDFSMAALLFFFFPSSSLLTSYQNPQNVLETRVEGHYDLTYELCTGRGFYH